MPDSQSPVMPPVTTDRQGPPSQQQARLPRQQAQAAPPFVVRLSNHSNGRGPFDKLRVAGRGWGPVRPEGNRRAHGAGMGPGSPFVARFSNQTNGECPQMSHNVPAKEKPPERGAAAPSRKWAEMSGNGGVTRISALAERLGTPPPPFPPKWDVLGLSGTEVKFSAPLKKRPDYPKP